VDDVTYWPILASSYSEQHLDESDRPFSCHEPHARGEIAPGGTMKRKLVLATAAVAAAAAAVMPGAGLANADTDLTRCFGVGPYGVGTGLTGGGVGWGTRACVD
jgi:hypothetical protein